jgi:hypothetical protein
VAFKADEPAELPDVIINGVTYKAFPPKKMMNRLKPRHRSRAIQKRIALDGGVDDAMESKRSRPMRTR